MEGAAVHAAKPRGGISPPSGIAAATGATAGVESTSGIAMGKATGTATGTLAIGATAGCSRDTVAAVDASCTAAAVAGTNDGGAGFKAVEDMSGPVMIALPAKPVLPPLLRPSAAAAVAAAAA